MMGQMQISVELLTEYVLIMSRIALMDKHMFAQLITASVPVLKMNETEIWDAILDEWWRRVCLLSYTVLQIKY